MVDITDLGRVLNAMLQNVENCVGAAYMEPQKMLASALRAGAAKCAEIAQEQLADVDKPEQTG